MVPLFFCFKSSGFSIKCTMNFSSINLVFCPLAETDISRNNWSYVRDMDSSLKFCCLFCFLVLVTISGLAGVQGAGPWGKHSPDQEAMNLYLCFSAAQDDKAAVSDSCCAQVKRIGQNPSCLCGVLMSDLANSYGIKPDIAITIPKRCNFANRPVGYKCGRK